MHIKKEWLTSHKKVVVATTISAILLTGMGVTVYAYTQRVDFRFANENKVIVEFGSEHDTNCSTYLKDGLQLEGCVVDVDGKKVKEKDYFQVGEYILTLKWNDKEISKHLEVKDTTPPTFEDFKEQIELEQGKENVVLTDFFKANDLSEVKVKVIGSVDYNTAGIYDITVKAIDAHNNAIEQPSKVVITEVEKEEVPIPTQATSQDNTTYQNDVTPTDNGGYTGTEVPQPTTPPQSQPSQDLTQQVPVPQPEPTPPANVCPVEDASSSYSNNSGMVFSSQAEARQYARTVIDDKTSSFYRNHYTVFPMGCESGTSNEHWGVYFVLRPKG